ncbi:MAG TPA: FAD-binding oxidoreductase [Anaeromyxobacteraceae bacterium]|nr:FAD-binding oxidoreductase [Anaeromyxobacteraceae bacterium]
MTPALARAATDVDTICGVRPRLAVEPRTVADAAADLEALAKDRLAIAFVGGGTDLELGAAPARLDAVVHTRHLSRVREYAPSDQIVAVEAGMTLAALQQHLAPHGQRLALDAPAAAQATVGGIVAANAFGPRRTRYGSVRDLVIGMTIVRADGVVARGGGKVVKNVAGFDLPRLLCGSLGTLGLIAEVTFRLHPLPERSATFLVGPLAAPEVASLTRATLDARLEPVAVTARAERDRLRLAIRLEGFAPGVRDQGDRLAALAGSAACELLEAQDEARLWDDWERAAIEGTVRAKATFAPAELPSVLEALRALAATLRDGELVVHPALGIARVAGDLQSAGDTARAVEAARRTVSPAGGALVLTAAPGGLRAVADVWGAAPRSIEIMRRLKRELDPENRLAPGRFVGGI